MTRPNVLKVGVGILVGIFMGMGGCSSHTTTIYWSKPGSGPEKLQQDKEECQALQRAVGLDEERIEKCLVAKGWLEVKRESEAESSEVSQ